MDKIQVGATIARAYGFAFGKFFTLLGIAWLPMIVMSGGGFVLTRQILAAMTAMQSSASYAEPPMTLLVLLCIAFVLLVLMLILGITEEALGLRRGARWIYFSFGRKLWLLAGTAALFLLAMMGAGLAVSIAVGLLGGLSALLGIAGRGVALVGVVAIFCALIFGFVRLSFLMTPVVAAEDRIGLERAWQLGKGNFWRMFVVQLAVLIPAMAVGVIFIVGFFWHSMPPALPHDANTRYDSPHAILNAAMMRQMMDSWYIIYPFFAAFSVIFYGLIAGAQAFAYRALVPEDMAESFR